MTKSYPFVPAPFSTYAFHSAFGAFFSRSFNTYLPLFHIAISWFVEFLSCKMTNEDWPGHTTFFSTDFLPSHTHMLLISLSRTLLLFSLVLAHTSRSPHPFFTHPLFPLFLSPLHRSFIGFMYMTELIPAENYKTLSVGSSWSYATEWSLTIVHATWVAALSMPTCRGPTKWLLTLTPLRYARPCVGRVLDLSIIQHIEQHYIGH